MKKDHWISLPKSAVSVIEKLKQETFNGLSKSKNCLIKTKSNDKEKIHLAEDNCLQECQLNKKRKKNVPIVSNVYFGEIVLKKHNKSNFQNGNHLW